MTKARPKLHAVASPAPEEPIRQVVRTARWFPDQLDMLSNVLSGQGDACAYLRLAAAYLRGDGNLRGDDQLLAAIAGLKNAAWQRLRCKLDENCIARVSGGRWIDFRLDESLKRQREYAAKQSARSRMRWSKKSDGGKNA